MKKILSILLVGVLLMTGCTPDSGGLTTPETTGVTETTVNPTEPPETTLPTVAQPKPEDYVTTGRREEITFMDGSKTYSYTLPKVLLNSQAAKDWNTALSQELSPVFDSAVAYAQVSRTGKYATIDYRAWIWEDVLTVLVTMPLSGTAQTEYRLGVFDYTTGEALNNGHIFTRITGEKTPASMGEVVHMALESGFDRLCDHIPEEERDKTYTDLREQTTAPENIAATLLYPEEDGTLVAVAKIYTPEAEAGERRLLPVTDFSAVAVSILPEAEATLEDLVTDYRDEELRYRDSLGNRKTVTLRIPQVNLNTPDGRDCNWLLADSLEPVLDKKIAAVEDDGDTKLQEINYEAWLWSGTLTVLVWMETNIDPTTYYIYTFDLKTGSLLDNGSIAALAGLDGQAYPEQMRKTLLNQYDTLYAEQKQVSGYNLKRELTGAGENVEKALLYLDAEGKLMVCGTVYGLADGEYTVCLLPVTGEA